ncbi:GMC oxidoreductase [Aquisalinus flavus]|uniref:GMC family oxidoreductase n=1 Tax=Aquisalinus flavus TaxID=1526572 RepID=A0A8J2Y7D8_9PROT|nr:GMC family oxidoreductase [Aquisalinus flavus]MBD0425772.1 GMC family oxidoreductase [Aquisalinus flavus]UNE48620.1 GMC family oxidoreductase [Aquisalinus flavus]GGD13436.1 GMC family oxidoreductase [Aquisalinus flavus]
MEFDAIVVGSGMSGGWAAKELCERGLKVLVIERGQHVEHGADYNDMQEVWEVENRGRIPEAELDEHYQVQRGCYAMNTANKHLFVKDSDHPYETPEGKPFAWLRGYHLGGRSLLWARHSYRLSEMDFEANKKDGHGVDWPIRYGDLAPWYDHVERFAGITGEKMGLDHLPDGEFQPAMALNCAESEFKAHLEQTYPGRTLLMGRIAHLTQPTEEQQSLGRGSCQYRDLCYRGCSFGAYFSALSATLPAAERTGNLTIVTDAIGHSVVYDPATGKASGVRVIDYHTKEGRTYTARMVFLCASAIGSALVMLNSTSERFPNGIANRSGALGRHLMDHISGIRAGGIYPGHEDQYYSGKRPGGIYIPRYRNLPGQEQEEFVRGFGIQGGIGRMNWTRGGGEPGVGVDLKEKLHMPGPWRIGLSGFGEMLPDPNNRVTLHPTKVDKWGIPLPVIDCAYGENEMKIVERCKADIVAMLESAGVQNIEVGGDPAPPGYGIHEMGTARMGRDPSTSVLNGWNQAHDVPNLFVTDGACMTSSACQNPSLTYMAVTARAANHAADLLQEGVL